MSIIILQRKNPSCRRKRTKTLIGEEENKEKLVDGAKSSEYTIHAATKMKKADCYCK
jgi:hypothetical protein